MEDDILISIREWEDIRMKSYGMIIGTKVQVGNRREESFAEWMTAEFPVVIVESRFRNYPNNVVPWHWHKEVELSCVTSGSVLYQIGQETIRLSEGEGGFLNSNVLHAIEPGGDPETDCHFVVIFYSDLLAGTPGSAIDMKYIRPLLGCESLPIIRFPRGDDRIKMLNQIALFMQEQPSGYEMYVRELLSEIWLQTYHQNYEIIHSESHGRNVEQERMKAMLTCIEYGYSGKMELREIAAAANISERECLRCFRKNVGCTPFEYLNTYRIQQAAIQLIQTDRSILDIAVSCGFSTGSYFGKKFREVMHCTPREYRERHR